MGIEDGSNALVGSFGQKILVEFVVVCIVDWR